MIDFDEELKKFQPALEVDQVEDAIAKVDLSDMTDLLKKMTTQAGTVSGSKVGQ